MRWLKRNSVKIAGIDKETHSSIIFILMNPSSLNQPDTVESTQMQGKCTSWRLSDYYMKKLLLFVAAMTIAFSAARSRPQTVNPQDGSSSLPWQREVSLREAARSVTLTSPLDTTEPNGSSTMSIDNLKMHTVLWGPPDRITISLTKNNVWDRRLHMFKSPTLQELTEGAFSPANKDYVGVKEIDSDSFAVMDITDISSLANKLADKLDPVSGYVSAHMDDKTKSSLAAYDTARADGYERGRALLSDLVASLNTILGERSFYNEQRFRGITLRPETQSLLERHPEGRDLVHLNRLLLEDAYPEISRRPGNSLRPFDLGWLRKEGGSYDPYRYPMRYAFPCLKPVGQIILGIGALVGADSPNSDAAVLKRRHQRNGGKRGCQSQR